MILSSSAGRQTYGIDIGECGEDYFRTLVSMLTNFIVVYTAYLAR